MNNNPYDTAKAKLEKLLNDFNEALPKEHAKSKVKVKDVINKMIIEGGTSIAGLRAFEATDFREFGFPRAIAVLAVDALLPKVKASTNQLTALSQPTVDVPTQTGGVQRITMVNERDAAMTMSPQTLLESYDPNNPGFIGEVLQQRSGNRAFLVWAGSEGTVLDRKASADRLQAMLDDVPVAEYVTIDGEAFAPLKVGEKPNMVMAENCLFPGEPLRQPGNMCHYSNASYDGISFETQQFLSVAKAQGHLRITQPKDVFDIIKEARNEGGFSQLKQMFPGAAVSFRNMTPAERPTLQIRKSNSVGGGAQGRPFARG